MRKQRGWATSRNVCRAGRAARYHCFLDRPLGGTLAESGRPAGLQTGGQADAAGGWLWELPAGKIDHPESPLQTAQRELQEEAGLAAGDWHSLGSFLSTPGFCDERIHLYLARTLTPVPADLHAHEVIEVHWLDYRQALEKAQNGEIEDAKTLIGLMLAAPLLA